MLLFMLGSGIFVAAGVWMLPREPVVAISCIVFFGLAAVVFAIGLHPKSSYLTLDEKGFLSVSLFRRTFVAWSNVQLFVPVTIHHNHMVGWNYAPGFRESASLRRLSSAMSGVEGALPDTYGMPAAQLAEMLNQLRVQYAKPAI
ncbi:hypothetical protein BWI17_03885 [Betaproteobacteria bacterium GR16-43]|nr:hypothetical protein BWI17_03885 [Betaproteobacteria bacterium GR16-43]